MEARRRHGEVFGCIPHGARAYARAPVRMRRRSFASKGSLAYGEPEGSARGRARAYARAPTEDPAGGSESVGLICFNIE